MNSHQVSQGIESFAINRIADWGLRIGGRCAADAARFFMGPICKWHVMKASFIWRLYDEITFVSGMSGMISGIFGVIGKVAAFGRNFYILLSPEFALHYPLTSMCSFSLNSFLSTQSLRTY